MAKKLTKRQAQVVGTQDAMTRVEHEAFTLGRAGVALPVMEWSGRRRIHDALSRGGKSAWDHLTPGVAMCCFGRGYRRGLSQAHADLDRTGF